jgi:hypothetical protein
MKSWILCSCLLVAGITALLAQDDANLFCRINKRCYATLAREQSKNIPLEAGEIYQVLGTGGRMMLIKIKNDPYYVADGCISIFKTTGHPEIGEKDTLTVPIDSVRPFKE